MQPINPVILRLLLPGWVSLADDFTHYIDLRLELMDSFFRILISQLLSLLLLSHDKLRLASLKVFVIALVEVMMVHEHFARVTDCRMEGIWIH